MTEHVISLEGGRTAYAAWVRTGSFRFLTQPRCQRNTGCGWDLSAAVGRQGRVGWADRRGPALCLGAWLVVLGGVRETYEHPSGSPGVER